jgi:LPS export ABC transporter protein LptC
MIYRLLPIFALVGLIIGVVVLSGPQREPVATTSVSGAMPDPGYAARNARLIQTGADGQPLYTLDAAQVQQQPDDGTVEMQQVQLGFRDPSGNEWTAHAARGELAQGSGVVQLEGNVHVAGILPGSNELAEMISEHLTYDTSAQVVATQDPVTLVMSGRELNAIGLTANLKERHVQLESAVHGSFHP